MSDSFKWVSPCKEECLETKSFIGTEHEGVNVCEDGCVRARKTLDELPIEDLKWALVIKRNKMGKETWVRNVLKVFPEKTQEEAEALWDKIYTQ